MQEKGKEGEEKEGEKGEEGERGGGLPYQGVQIGRTSVEGDIPCALVRVGNRLPHREVRATLQLAGLREQNGKGDGGGEEEGVVGEVVLHGDLDDVGGRVGEHHTSCDHLHLGVCGLNKKNKTG